MTAALRIGGAEVAISYLHDDSVKSLDALLNKVRGPSARHPFYLRPTAQRADMIAYLRSLDTTSH